MILALLLMVVMPMMAERVAPETARKVAETFLNNNGAKSSQLTDLTKEAGFSNLYIFNAEQGFVIIAADDCVKPILGYSLTGRFVVEGLPTNILKWLESYNDAIQHAMKNSFKATTETTQLWKDLTEGKTGVQEVVEIVPALVKTQWSQGSPYNNLCPGVTGCVATAMAQIMKYWGFPEHGIGSHSYTCNNQNLSADFASTSYDWEHMINSYSSSSTDVEKQAVATLMYHCGVSVNMEYAWNESSASTFDVVSALKSYFNYSPAMSYENRSDYNDSDWIALLKAELDHRRPIQYRGSRNPNGGHSFICDGYDSNDLFHFNWGWGGQDDGFFDIDIMGTSMGSYTIDQAAIIGIEPVHCNADDPINLILAQNGRHISLNWDPANGATSYNIYRNGSLIGNCQTNSYEDVSAPFGINSYYVRSMDSEGNLSFASNVESATVNYNTDGMVVDALQVKYKDGTSSLQWASPARLQYLDYFTFLGNVYYTGDFDKWAARFPASYLSTYSGLSVTTVASYFYSDGQYTAKLYQCTGYPTGEAIASVTQTFEKGWHTITFDTPHLLDTDKDLWVVFECPGIYLSTLLGAQPSDNGNWLYYKGAWEQFNGYSFFISAYLTDGNFTYSLYRNGEMIVEDLVNNVYSDNSPINDAANLYTVKLKYAGTESDPSNMAGIALGSARLDADLVMGTHDMMTLIENSSLTISGALVNTNPDNLILEDGAQLINNSEGVKATVKKAIQPYTEGHNDGWNLIASPVIEDLEADDVPGLLRNEYDLYAFDPSGTDDNGNAKEWRNYKAGAFTDIKHKVGYLYANSEETTLTFAGTLAGIAEATELSLNAGDFAGFNLIGNPYPCNAYANKPFYVLQYNQEEDNTSFVPGSNPIPPCSAILVQAQNDGETVSFSKTPIAEPSSIVMHLSEQKLRSNTALDEARISFEEQCQLTKYTWGKAASTIYIPQNGQNFAVACANGQNEMPLNFKAAKNGTYTLDFKVENMEADYLHLIDNMTGADVDLLATPSYSFEGKADDYESRFKLVFSNYEDANDDNVHFAYYADGEIRLVETCHGASLQVVDMMGHVVLAGDAMNRVSTNGMTAGVYVLRLINGNDVKTQKIVIE